MELAIRLSASIVRLRTAKTLLACQDLRTFEIASCRREVQPQHLHPSLSTHQSERRLPIMCMFAPFAASRSQVLVVDTRRLLPYKAEKPLHLNSIGCPCIYANIVIQLSSVARSRTFSSSCVFSIPTSMENKRSCMP